MSENTEALSELRGMPVFTADTGNRLGEVDHVFIDPDSRSIRALAFHNRRADKETYVLREDVTMLGEDLLMIRSADVAKSVEDGAEPGRRFRKLRGLSVVTDAGQNLGKLEDFDVTRGDGLLSELHLSGGDSLPVSPRDVTIGPDVILVPGKYAAKIVHAPEKKGLFDRVKDWTDQHVRSSGSSQSESATAQPAQEAAGKPKAKAKGAK